VKDNWGEKKGGFVQKFGSRVLGKNEEWGKNEGDQRSGGDGQWKNLGGARGPSTQRHEGTPLSLSG